MLIAAVACLLSLWSMDAKRSDPSRFVLSDETTEEAKIVMTASEAVSQGLIKAWDAPPRTAAPKGFASFLQNEEHVNETELLGKKTEFCPKLEGPNALCMDKPCDIRNLVYITCLEAENLPSQFGDKVDPYVWFWVDNKKNVAATPEYSNNENPKFSWGCPFAYDGKLNFDGEVWDSDLGRDDLVGEIASSGGVQIDEKFLAQYDKDGDGRFQLGLFIYSNGKKVQQKKGVFKKTKKDSLVKFEIELIKAPGYELRRVGSADSRQSRGPASYSVIG